MEAKYGSQGAAVSVCLCVCVCVYGGLCLCGIYECVGVVIVVPISLVLTP